MFRILGIVYLYFLFCALSKSRIWWFRVLITKVMRSQMKCYAFPGIMLTKVWNYLLPLKCRDLNELWRNRWRWWFPRGVYLPFFAESYDIIGLCYHINDEHTLESKNTVFLSSLLNNTYAHWLVYKVYCFILTHHH